MPCMRRENVRHATLLFCAEGVNVRTIGAGEGRKQMPNNWSQEEWVAFRQFVENVNPQSLHPLYEDHWRADGELQWGVGKESA